jgi:hypothetical protein
VPLPLIFPFPLQGEGRDGGMRPGSIRLQTPQKAKGRRPGGDGLGSNPIWKDQGFFLLSSISPTVPSTG